MALRGPRSPSGSKIVWTSMSRTCSKCCAPTMSSPSSASTPTSKSPPALWAQPGTRRPLRSSAAALPRHRQPSPRAPDLSSPARTGRGGLGPALRGLFGFDQVRLDRRLDLDAAWFQLLRQLALQRNGEQAVGKLGVHHDHVVGELEPALEVALGQSAMQEPAGLVVRRLAALNGQHV